MRKYAWIYIIFTVFLVIWGVRYFKNKPVSTEIARLVEYEDSVATWSVIVRNEKTYKTNVSGSLQPQVFDETRVSKGTRIATVYTGGIDSELKAELDNISEKIAKLEAATPQSKIFGSDIAAIEARVKTNVEEIVDASLSADMSNLGIVSKELDALVGTQKEVAGNQNPRQKALRELYQEKKDIEVKIDSTKKDIYSTAGGVYISGVDGCEEILTPEAVMNMSVEEFASINIPKRAEPKEMYEAGEKVCKTVDNGIWYAATVLNVSDFYGMETGDNVRLRAPEISSDAVDGHVEFISEPSGERILVVISSRNYIKGIYGERCLNIDVIKANYSGLKIPINSVRVVDDEIGVFVNSDGVARFKKIDILYKDENSAIVKKSDETGYLKLYDPVITDVRDIEAGKYVN